MNHLETSITLDDILITDQLSLRPGGRRDAEAENQALHALARQMASGSEAMLHTLVEAALRLCGAGSAGVSLMDTDEKGEEVFRWVALTGAYAAHVGGTTPRHFSPCGTCLALGKPQLYWYPDRLYTYFQTAAPPRIVEGLVIPMRAGGQDVGTIWIVSHDEQTRFDADDVRTMTALADFSAAALVLDRARTRAQEADRRKDEFLATLAHELRNPLAPIRYAIDIIERSPADSPSARDARQILRTQVGHLKNLVDDLLDVSRIANDKITLRTETIDAQSAVREAVQSCHALLTEKAQPLALSLPDESVWLDADRTRLTQILSNLLNNASKYSGPGSPIELVAERDGRELVVRVKDRGRGIPPAMLDQIFEPFVQVSPTLDGQQGGLGLGLPLVRRLVRMHGGSVIARSDGIGHGSEFVVRLPLAPKPAPTPAPTPACSPDAALHPRRVLVVEDNADSARLLSELLKLDGHQVRIAHDGRAALDAAQEFAPELVLLDIGLPGLDGYEVARRLRSATCRDAQLVALTGYGQDDDRRHATDAGFDHHFTKPVDPDALRALITRPSAASHAAT